MLKSAQWLFRIRERAMCRDLNQASASSLFQAVRCSRQEGREEPM